MTSNIIISGNGKQVTISTEKVEKNFTNVLTIINIPQSTGNKESGPKDSKIINLQRIEIRFTIDGTLKTGLGTNDTSSTATGKYDDLEYMYKIGGDKQNLLTLNYRGTDFKMVMDKLSISEKSTDEETAPSSYEIKLTCVIGVGM